MKRYILKIVIFDLLLIEFGPVIVFLAVFRATDFFKASLSLALATFFALIISRLVNKRLPYFALFTGAVTIATSFFAYYFKLPNILIIEDSLFQFLFLAVLCYSTIKGKLVLKRFFEHIFLIEDKAWRILELRWLTFFLLGLVSNEVFRVFYSTEAWVEYKKYYFIIFLIFGIYQFRLSAKYGLEGSDRLGVRRNSSLHR